MRKSYKRFHTLFSGILRFILGVKVSGLENEPESSGILVCANHVTLLDPICISAALHKVEPYYMAKKELFKIPILKSLLKAFGAYPVNRGEGDLGAIHKTIDMLRDGYCVGIFPQGTRCRGVALEDTKFKNGAALICSKISVPVLPICIKVKNNRWRPFRKMHVFIGKPITAAELAFDENAPRGEELARITNIIYERILSLGEEKGK